MYRTQTKTSINNKNNNNYRIGTHLAKQVTVEDLEDLIEAKLAETLHGVADEGWCPALSETPHTILLYCDRESIEDAFVLGWVHLEFKTHCIM